MTEKVAECIMEHKAYENLHALSKEIREEWSKAATDFGDRRIALRGMTSDSAKKLENAANSHFSKMMIIKDTMSIEEYTEFTNYLNSGV